MSKKEIEVTFKTITPIWTGDINGECTEIKPASIMGSLRFWFEVYCHFSEIKVKENENLDYKTFEKIRKEAFEKYNKKEISDIEKYIIKKLPLTAPSKIFGCTGWKSGIEIEKLNSNIIEINKNEFDYKFLFDDFSTEWWNNKILFNNKNQIKLFENIKINLKINTVILEEFKKFLKFYENKVILVGGKKSFGFGFTKLKSNINLENVSINIKNKDYIIWKQVDNIKNNKKVLGYNFKYFLRQKEDKKYRKINFGSLGVASNYYFSNLINDSIIIIAFNNNKNVLTKYKNWITERLEHNKNNKFNNKNEKSIQDLINLFSNR